MAAVTIRATIERLTHLWSAGMMYQGAHLVLVAPRACLVCLHVVVPVGPFSEYRRSRTSIVSSGSLSRLRNRLRCSLLEI